MGWARKATPWEPVRNLRSGGSEVSSFAVSRLGALRISIKTSWRTSARTSALTSAYIWALRASRSMPSGRALDEEGGAREGRCEAGWSWCAAFLLRHLHFSSSRCRARSSFFSFHMSPLSFSWDGFGFVM